jgi:hypothetical protein
MHPMKWSYRTCNRMIEGSWVWLCWVGWLACVASWTVCFQDSHTVQENLITSHKGMIMRMQSIPGIFGITGPSVMLLLVSNLINIGNVCNRS